MIWLIIIGVIAVFGGIYCLFFLRDMEIYMCFVLAGLTLAIMSLLLFKKYEQVEEPESYKIVVSENVHIIGHDTTIGEYQIVQR